MFICCNLFCHIFVSFKEIMIRLTLSNVDVPRSLNLKRPLREDVGRSNREIKKTEKNEFNK